MKFKYLYIISLLFIFFPCFVFFFIPKSTLYIMIGVFFWLIIYYVLLTKYKKHFFKYISTFFRTKLFYLYLIFILYVICTTVIHLILGYSLATWFKNLFDFLRFISAYVLVYFLPMFSSIAKINSKTLCKFLYIALLIVYLIGLLQYIGFIFDINLIHYFINFITNSRYGYRLSSDIEVGRVFSTFMEANVFAMTIFQILPVLIVLNFSKLKIFENNKVNFIIKKAVLLLTILMLLLAKSPIWLIFCSIEIALICFIVYFKQLKKILIKNFILIMIFLLSMFFIFASFESSDNKFFSYFERITITLNSAGNISQLVSKEPSLASRLISDKTNILTFLENPIFGVGLHNSSSYGNKTLMLVDTPLTLELILKYVENGYPGINPTMLFTFLAEFGLVGTSIFYLFLIYNIVILNKLKKYLFEYDLLLCNGIKYFIIVSLCVSFYDFHKAEPLFWFLLGFVPMLYVRYKMNNQKMLLIKNNVPEVEK